MQIFFVSRLPFISHFLIFRSVFLPVLFLILFLSNLQSEISWNDAIYSEVIKYIKKNPQINPRLKNYINSTNKEFDTGFSAGVLNPVFSDSEEEMLDNFEELYNHIFISYGNYLWSEYLGFVIRYFFDLYNPVEFNMGAYVSDEDRNRFKKNLKNIKLNLKNLKITNIESFRKKIAEEIKINARARNDFITNNNQIDKNSEMTKKTINTQLIRGVGFLTGLLYDIDKKIEFKNKSGEKISEYIYLGNCYSKIRQLSQVERVYKKMISKHPDKTISYYMLACLYLERGWEDFACDVLLGCINKKISDKNIYFLITDNKAEIKEKPDNSAKVLKIQKYKDLLNVKSNVMKFPLDEWLKVEYENGKTGYIISGSGSIVDMQTIVFMLAVNLERIKGKSILYKKSKDIWKLLMSTRFKNIAKANLSANEK